MPAPARPLAQRANDIRRIWPVVLLSYAAVLVTVILLPPLGSWLGYTSYREQIEWDGIKSTVGIAVTGTALAVMVAVLIFLKITGRLRRSDDLVISEGSLVAPFCTSEYAVMPILGVQLLAQLLGAFTRPHVDMGWSTEQLLGAGVLTGLIAAIVAGYVVGYLRGNHGLVISTAGVQVPKIFGSLLVPWIALDEHTTLPPSRRDAVELVVVDPAQVIRMGPVLRRRVLRIQSSLVNQVFLAEVIRYYVEHPEHRAAIGTAVGYDRLRADLADTEARPERVPFFPWSTRTEDSRP